MKTSIIFTRYNNNYGHLRDYKKHDKVDYILIDDGSKDDPILADFWQIYKVTEDIGWNSEGAKNLGMKVMQTDWGLTCDMDHPLYIDDVDKLDALTDKLDPWVAYNPVRVDGKCINSYLMHRDLWWHPKVNGYDESYSGSYGYDRTLGIKLKQHFSKVALPDLTLGIKRESESMTRSAKHKIQIFPTADDDLGVELTDERIRFPWKRIQ